MNHSEGMLQRLSECHTHHTFQEDIFLLLRLRTAPRNPEFIKSMHRAACKAPSSLGSGVGGGGESLCQTSTPCSSYRRSSHSKVKLNLHEDACFTWRLSVVLRTPKRKEKKKKPCGIYDGPVIYTEVLDNLDKNVTASLHVLQIHGVKPLEQLMESSHIISC